MLTIKEAILVEGRYDKAKVAAAADALIIAADGFSIFNNAEKRALLARLTEERGLIILTDSDPAGFLIRNKLKGMLPGKVKHAYMPQVAGKERRKTAPSKAGLLGVEGFSINEITNALLNAGATVGDNSAPREPWLTKADMFALGLSGGDFSATKRNELLQKLRLPGGMSANAFIDCVNILCSEEEFYSLLKD